jgi:hypothetical protein
MPLQGSPHHEHAFGSAAHLKRLFISYQERRMSRLSITAFREDALTSPANRLPNTIILSVADENGMPVTRLTAGNFSIVPFRGFGPNYSVQSVNSGPLPGFYTILLKVTVPHNWPVNIVSVFEVAVERRPDHGQTIATAHITTVPRATRSKKKA